MKWYTVTDTPVWAPSVWRGGWDKVSTNVRITDPIACGSTAIGILLNSENVATSPYRVGICRFISRRLAAQTISGTLDMIMGVSATNADADFYTRLHAYVTEGDTDVVRGTLLTYEETIADVEWPVTASAVGRGLSSPQALTSVVVSEGDRLVIEFGFISFNVHVTSRQGWLRYGSVGPTLDAIADLTIGSANVSSEAGTWIFSGSVVSSATEPTNLSKATSTLVSTLPYDVTPVTPADGRIALWWRYVGVSGDHGTVGVFAGATVVGQQIRTNVWGLTNSLVGTQQQLQVPVLTGETYYFSVDESSGLTFSTPRVQVYAAPHVLPASPRGQVFISDDALNSYPQSEVLDRATGSLQRFVYGVAPSEDGVVLDPPGTIFLVDSYGALGSGVLLYNKDFTLLVNDASLVADVAQVRPPVAKSNQYFYAAWQTASGSIRLRRWSHAGVLNASSWLLTRPAAWTDGVFKIAVAPDDSIVYYDGSVFQAGIVGEPIKRWNLVTDLAMSDFVTPPGDTGFWDLFVLADTSVLTMRFQTTGSVSSVVRYSAAGAVQQTYTLPAFPTYDFVIHITPNPVDDLSWFVAWMQKTGVPQVWEFRTIQLSDGAVLSTSTGRPFFNDGVAVETIAVGAVPPTAERFGVPVSCPLLILGDSTPTTGCTDTLSPAAAGGGSGCADGLDPAAAGGGAGCSATL